MRCLMTVSPPWVRRLIVLVTWLGWFGFLSPIALANEDDDNRVKANYLHNFTKFIDWPNLADDTVHICIVGSEPIVNLLAQIASRDLKGHNLQIWSGFDDPKICQILFVSRVETALTDLLKQVQGIDVLTVSDADDFARRGGAIGFYADGGQIKLEINPDALRNAHLKANAMLMEIARVVR